MKKSTMFLLWMGASISIAEIFTGGLLGPLGMAKGLAAILIGHIIGVSLLAFGGYISFKRGQNAMESVVFCFGKRGGRMVAAANVLQLIGWTIVMIVQASSAISSVLPNFSFALAALILSALVLLWALIFGSPAERLNDVVVVLLALLCLALFAEAASHGPSRMIFDEKIGMALAIELSIAMPVSWLPLIGDYSVRAKDKTGAALVPFAGYFIGSCLMYTFGLYIAVTNGRDIFAFIAESPLRYPACAVVLLSTVTTAFLDLYSAAMSSQQLIKTKNERTPILVIGLFAAAISVIFPMERYGDFLTSFLTGIGMFFVPVYSILFVDYLLKRKPGSGMDFKLGVALVGMVVYQRAGYYELWIPTLLSILTVLILYIPYAIYNKGEKI